MTVMPTKVCGSTPCSASSCTSCVLLLVHWQAAWAEELKLKGSNGKLQPSLIRALRKSFGVEVFVAGVWKMTWSVLVLLGECLRSTLLSFCEASASLRGLMPHRTHMMASGRFLPASACPVL